MFEGFLFGYLLASIPLPVLIIALLFGLLGHHPVADRGGLFGSFPQATTPEGIAAAERHIAQIKQIDPNDPTRGIIAALIVAAGIASAIAIGYCL